MAMCIYCSENAGSSTEHVFPKGLGGASVYMSCVCEVCNQEFSVLEAELMQRSYIALMRTAEGLQGYTTKDIRPAALKGADAFQYVEQDNASYEVGVYHGLNAFVRGQFIEIDDKIYIACENKNDVVALGEAVRVWKNGCSLLVTNVTATSPKEFIGYRIVKVDSEYITEPVKVEKMKGHVMMKLAKANLQYVDSFGARIFLDDFKQLILRCTSESQGLNFLFKLMHIIDASTPMTSYSGTKEVQEIISVRMSFDVVLMQRALVKIGLNVLIHYFPKALENESLIQPAIKFVKTGNSAPEFRVKVHEQKDGLDVFECCHTIEFLQHRDCLQVRMSLFSGSFVYSFFLTGLRLGSSFLLGGLRVNYKEKTQEFLNPNEWIAKKNEHIVQKSK